MGQYGTLGGRKKRSTRKVAVGVTTAVAMFASVLFSTGAAVGAQADPTTETFVTIVDDQGPDQLDQANDPGNSQQDISGARVGSEGSFGWAWDETDLSGNNSIDTCTYFQETDGSVVSLCYSVQFEPDGTVTDGFPTFEVYDCGSSRYDGGQQKCTGNNPLAGGYTVDCTNPEEVASYFAGDNQPDLQADCSLTPNDDLLLLNTCTKTSASPSSNSNDCLFSDAVGFVQLEKVVLGDTADPSAFILNAGPVSGSGPVVELSPITAETSHLLSESSALIDDGQYVLDSVVCTDNETNLEVPTPDDQLTVDIAQEVTCVFTNVQALAAPFLEVVKTAGDAPDGETYEIDENGGEVTFTVSITNGGGEGTITALQDDVHTDAVCIDADGIDIVGQLIGAEETLTCTFTGEVTGNAGFSETNTVSATVSNAAGDVVETDDASVLLADVPSSIEVTKTADVAELDEPGGLVVYTITVKNTSAVDPVTVTTVTDPALGGDITEFCDVGDDPIPTLLAPQESFVCEVSVTVVGNANDTIVNTASATGFDDDGNNDLFDSGVWSIEILDVEPVPLTIEKSVVSDAALDEEGGDFDFQVVITNPSLVDTATITDIDDTFLEDLQDSATCVDEEDEGSDLELSPGEQLTCTFTITHEGQPDEFTNTVTVVATDDDGADVGGVSNDVQVEILDLPPSIDVTKTANVAELNEPGGEVTYTVTVKNTSAVDIVTISSVVDPMFGDAFTDSCTPGALIPEESFECQVTTILTGNAFDTISNTATAQGVDDQGVEVSDSSTYEIDILDVPSEITVTKKADLSEIPESGADVTFTVTVENTSQVDTVTIDSVVDSVFGDVSASCDVALPADLVPGDSLDCVFTEFVSGQAGETHTNIATASGTDDDDGAVSAIGEIQIPFVDVMPAIAVEKSADPATVPETGADVAFTVVVTNSSTEEAELTALVDSDFGDLDGQGDCAVPQTLAAANPLSDADSYTCSFTANVAGDFGVDHENTVTATAADDDGNTVEGEATENVVFIDVLPDVSVEKVAVPSSVPETGADVEFSIAVKNESLEDATVSSLTDTVFDLSEATRCADAIGTVLASGESYTCSFTEFVAGNVGDDHENTVTAVLVDDDDNQATDEEIETVVFTDVLPVIDVDKVADPETVPETGGDVTFTVTVANTGLEAATITAITDSVFADLPECQPDADDAALAPTGDAGDSYTCTFVRFVEGDAGVDHVNEITATAEDDEGNAAEASDLETVVFGDVLPDIAIVKTATPEVVAETGEDVEFTITVLNESLEPVTIDSLADSDFGIPTECALDDPTVLAPVGADGDAFSCTFTRFVEGNVDADHKNTATVAASDDEGNEVKDFADETVEFSDVLPAISVTKTADPESVLETGGDVTFTFVITNTTLEAATLTKLVDTEFGNLDGAGTCSLSQQLAAFDEASDDDSYTCEVTETIDGNVGVDHENTVSATAVDDEGNSTTGDASETVSFEDVLPAVTVDKVAVPDSVPETGADVEFTITVTNESLEDATVTAFEDSVFDLAARCPGVINTTLAASGQETCSFTAFVDGNVGADHTNTVTATLTDDEGNEAESEAAEVVVFTDVVPTVDIDKSASASEVSEPGDDVEFTLLVTNTSLEPVTITALSDSDFELSPECEAGVGTLLASAGQDGDSFSCTFTGFVAGNAADGPHTNTATVKVTDDEDNDASAFASEEVAILDTAPTITVTKVADQDEIFAPGEEVTFTITIGNTSVETDPVTIQSLDDTVFGDLAGLCGLPVVIDPGESSQCEVVASITDDHENTVTATGVDDEGASVEGAATETVDASSPSISIEKATEGVDADAGPGPALLVGSAVEWTYVVSNDGDVRVTDLTVVDDQGVDVSCDLDELEPGDTANCIGSAPAVAGEYMNLGTATASYEDADGDEFEAQASDPSHYFGADPSLSLDKEFADDVVAAGEQGSFVITATNEGNVTLTDVEIIDLVDPRLGVVDVSGTLGVNDDGDGDAQTIEWFVPVLDPGEAVTLTVIFAVDSSATEADGDGGLNNEPPVDNRAQIASTYVDDVGNEAEIDAEASDSIGVIVQVGLSVTKTFTPDSVVQGAAQTFTIEVVNNGPSDAADVTLTDVVDDSLSVIGVVESDGEVDCGTSAGQRIECTAFVPAGASVSVTVEYTVAPFLNQLVPGEPIYGTESGDEFRFVFLNGVVLEGSTDGGPVLVDGVDIIDDPDRLLNLTKNDLYFDPDGEGGEPAIELHLSCSDPFTNGWGQSAGPREGINSDEWRVGFFSVTRYQNGDFRKDCANIPVPFEIENTVDVLATDSEGEIVRSDSAAVSLEAGVTVSSLRATGKRLTVRLANQSDSDKVVESIYIRWPAENGALEQVRLDEPVAWSGAAPANLVVLDDSVEGWMGATLVRGDSILRFDFEDRVEREGYVVEINLDDGTSVEIDN